MSNVDTLCTTDDPVDDLRYHKALAEDASFKVKVYPAFRPDKVVNVDWDTYVPYVKTLSGVVGYEIKDLYDLEKALAERVEFFHEAGCRISDHALDVVMYESASKEEVNEITIKALKGETLTKEEVAKLRGKSVEEIMQ
jgi:glucuronate isomerase